MELRYLRRPRWGGRQNFCSVQSTLRVVGSQIHWFDLDNTLHHASRAILPLINQAMTAYIASKLGLTIEAASTLRHHYWRRYGASMLGLVRHHDVCAHDFLHATHPMPHILPMVRRSARVADFLRRTVGRRMVLTNAPEHYARQVLKAMGCWGQIDGLVAVEQMRLHGRWCPKPAPRLWQHLKRRCRGAGHVLYEDTFEHLHVARRYGFHGVWRKPRGQRRPLTAAQRCRVWRGW